MQYIEFDLKKIIKKDTAILEIYLTTYHVNFN